MYSDKKEILKDYPELELSDFGDFKIKESYVEDYEIIDFHSHLFDGLKGLFPGFLRNESENMEASFFDESCYPISLNLFDMNETCFTKYLPDNNLISKIKARYKLLVGGFIMKRATVRRLLRDMEMNHIRKSIVMQIHPPNKESVLDMDKIVKERKEIMTFGAIHPYSSNIKIKIDKYLESDIKGWKLNPHVANFEINDKKTIDLIKNLADTKMPILSCSGLGVPENILNNLYFTKSQKTILESQRISKFYEVLRQIPDVTFILAHGGLYEIEELIELMNEFPNTYTDISVQPARNIKRLIDSVGSDRLLFGTDYPFINQAISIVSVLRATSSERDRKNIFSKNALRILELRNE